MDGSWEEDGGEMNWHQHRSYRLEGLMMLAEAGWVGTVMLLHALVLQDGI